LGPIDINLCELLFLNELAGVNYSFFQTWNGDLTCFPKMTIKTKTRKYVFTWIFRQFMFSAFSQKGRNFCCFGGRWYQSSMKAALLFGRVKSPVQKCGSLKRYTKSESAGRCSYVYNPCNHPPIALVYLTMLINANHI
jgi:hypothetical protein